MGGSQLLGSLLQSGQRNTGVAVPGDLGQARSGQIDLLNSLLPAFGQRSGAGGGFQNALGPLSQYFGNLGVPQSDLQRQSAGGISALLSNQSPAMSALNTAFPTLQGMLTGTGPQFERDLSLANQQGQRFGSANEILRGEALRNLFNLRNQTAGTIGMLGQQQGNLFGQGFGIGQAQAQQGDIGLQRLLNLFGGLFGARQQMVAGLPITQQPTFGQTLGQNLSGLGMLLPFLGGGGSPGGAPAGTQAFGPGFDLMALLGQQTPNVNPGTGIIPATPQMAR
jgi:hypothetical protein